VPHSDRDHLVQKLASEKDMKMSHSGKCAWWQVGAVW
jgi:hypothetical protein